MAKQEVSEVKRRAHVADFRIHFNGVLEAAGNLYMRTKPKAAQKAGIETHMACPVHASKGEAVRVEQKYLCTIDKSAGHGQFSSSECARGQMSGEAFTLIDGQARQAAKEASELPDKRLDLVAHAASEVDPWISQSGQSYFFEPVGEPSPFMAILTTIMRDDGTIATEHGPIRLVGQTLIKKEEYMVVLGKSRGRITVNVVARPEDLVDVDPLNLPAPEDRVTELARTLMANSIETFDPDKYADAQRQRVRDAVAAGDDYVAPKPKPNQTTDDLVALLEASIASTTA